MVGGKESVGEDATEYATHPPSLIASEFRILRAVEVAP